jgi:hypothetical protein
MPGWTSLANLIAEEEKQLIEEGAEPIAAQNAAKSARDLLSAGADENSIWAPFADLPRRNDFPFVEPSNFDEVRAARTAAPHRSTSPMTIYSISSTARGSAAVPAAPWANPSKASWPAPKFQAGNAKSNI